MSDPILSAVLTQLGSILESQIRQELRLVVGVDRDIEHLKNTLRSIEAVMVDAEKKQVKDKSVEQWLQRLQEAVYDMDDVLNEWNAALLKAETQELGNSTTPHKKVCSFIPSPCFCFTQVAKRRDIALKIQRINGNLDLIAREKDRYNFAAVTGYEGPERAKTTSFVDGTRVRGRDGDKATLVAQLLMQGGRGMRPLHTISIVGMGGIGKTTLAQLAYHSEQVKAHFPTRMWVCVSEPFDDLRVAKAIVESLEGSAPNLFELETVLGRVRDRIEGQKFLLVLDDVWTENYERLEPLVTSLSSGAPGSKVLVTTRNERVAQMMESSYLLRLGELTEEDCWSLFSQLAFSERSQKDCEELKDIGMRIASKCKGLPLATKTIGSLMRFKTSFQDWKNVLESDVWDLEAKKGIFPPLLLSYYDLPLPVKRCFSYCAIFPQDYEIEADNLIKLWMAQGYLGANGTGEMEATGREYLNTLVMRSFFQMKKDKDKGRDNATRLKMHDMVLDLARYLRKTESYVMEVDSRLVHRINSSCDKARHLTLIRSEDVHFPKSIGNLGKLHTFWVQSFYDSPPIVSEVDRISPDLFDRLVHLKALDLSRNRLCELSEEIDKLTNLRYLNLSHNPFWELPQTICDLYNLETLKLVACDHLRQVPKGIGKLRNLRHLEIDRTGSLRTLPKGIGELPSLQTLTKFVLAASTDGGETICTIGDLSSLNQLRGCLRIEGLGYVASADQAEKAQLRDKKHLADLHLDFNPQMQAGGRTDVADALQLCSDLQTLHLSFYGGARLPIWMTSLNNLRKLRLQDCPNCNTLPPLGMLASLENLCLENMHGLKIIGTEHFGRPDLNGCMQTNGAPSTAAVTIFPKLKKLKFAGMSSWEKWDITSKDRVAKEGNLSIMPYLRYLKLSDCSKLNALPDHLLEKTPIRKLYIHNCPLLQQQYQKRSGEHHTKLSQISRVRIS